MTGTDSIDGWPSAFDGWSGSAKPGDVDGSFTRRHEWSFRGERIVWSIELPVSVYQYCSDRARIHDYAVYLVDPFQSPFVASLAERLDDFFAERSLRGATKVEATARFVQHLEYSRDVDDTGHEAYPKYPVETFFHRQGDCEDGTILLGALLHELGFDVAVLTMPNAQHMVLGVALDDVSGASVEADGTEYTLVETTEVGWNPGELPRKYRRERVEIVHPEGTPVLVHQWEAKPSGDRTVDVDVYVANFGNGPAEETLLQVAFKRRDGSVVAHRSVPQTPTTLPVGDSRQYECALRLPTDEKLRGTCTVGIDGIVHDESQSKWR